jgi:hypothetical protein
MEQFAQSIPQYSGAESHRRTLFEFILSATGRSHHPSSTRKKRPAIAQAELKRQRTTVFHLIVPSAAWLSNFQFGGSFILSSITRLTGTAYA